MREVTANANINSNGDGKNSGNDDADKMITPMTGRRWQTSGDGNG
jgi:hypothetical protein